MKKKDKPLPKPPGKPFGSRRSGEKEPDGELLADKMAEAAALGGLDQFLERELPDSEHARTLAKMMMGMTGMMPPDGSGGTAGAGREGPAPEPPSGPAPEGPPGVREAALAGDVKGLIDLLRQEQLKRSGGDAGPDTAPPEPAAEPPDELPAPEREVLDRLIALAQEHKVSPDWIILRALKLYIEEYDRTGRL